jgi:type VI secretion system protein ImpI
MTLRLSIENVDRLPDGGPLRIEVRSRGLDIGRDAHLDWTLPDPSRHISGKHCEIRFHDGGYWLHDVSTNGTFVNGAQFRLAGPHLLADGDRLTIGAYVIAVEVKGGRAAAPAAAAASAAGGDLWSEVGAAAAEDRKAYQASRDVRPPADFLDFAASLNPDDTLAASFAPPPPAPDDAWIHAASAPMAAVEPAMPTAPTPRRPAPAPTAPLEPVASAALQTPLGEDLVARLAAAAGIPARALAGRDPGAVVDEIGAAFRLSVENLALLLNSRAETKSLMRSSSRTMIRALENNPLKFTPSTEDALAIMFGPPTRNYLDARATIEQSFADLKSHQLLSLAATQAALEGLFEDLAPEKIDKSVEAERGLGALVGSRKARLWDVFVERWRAATKRADGRLTEAFAALFAEAYDRLQNKR